MNKIKEIIRKIANNQFWSSLIKNAFSAFVGDTGASIINVLIMIVIIKYIGNAGYGVLVLGQTYMTICDTFINFQCWHAVIKFGQEAIHEKNETKLFSVIKSGILIDLATAVAGIIIANAILPIIANLMNWNATIVIVSKIFCIVIIFHFSGTPTGILRLFDKFKLVALQKISVTIFKLVCIVVAGSIFNVDVIGMSIIYAITDIIGHFVLVIMAFYQLHLKFGIRKVLRVKVNNVWKMFFKFTLWTSLTSSADIPVQQFDVIIISKFMDIQMVAVYKVFKQIVQIMNKLTTPIYQAILPQFASLVAQNKTKQGVKVYRKIRKTVILILIPFSLLAGFTSPIWLDIIFGDLYASQFIVLLVYMISQSIALSNATIHPLFVAMGYVQQAFYFTLLSNIIYLIITIPLIISFQIMGMVIGFTIQYSIIICLKYWYINKNIS